MQGYTSDGRAAATLRRRSAQAGARDADGSSDDDIGTDILDMLRHFILFFAFIYRPVSDGDDAMVFGIANVARAQESSAAHAGADTVGGDSGSTDGNEQSHYQHVWNIFCFQSRLQMLTCGTSHCIQGSISLHNSPSSPSFVNSDDHLPPFADFSMHRYSRDCIAV